MMKKMVAADVEQRFVGCYVTPDHQEQVRCELASAQLRRESIRSFSEFHRHMLRSDKLHFLRANCQYGEIIAFVNGMHCDETTPVYIMHCNRDYDRRVLPLRDALILLWYAGPCLMMPLDLSFVFCIMEPGGYACSKALLYGE